MTEKFKIWTLSHTVLYAKGWYKASEDIFEDLKKILELDDYTPFTKADIFNILLSSAERFEHQAFDLREMIIGVHPKECWKVGYHTVDSFCKRNNEVYPQYNYETAIVYYILSILRNLETEKWNVVTPKYSKFPKNPEISIKRVIEQFNRKES